MQPGNSSVCVGPGREPHVVLLMTRLIIHVRIKKFLKTE